MFLFYAIAPQLHLLNYKWENRSFWWGNVSRLRILHASNKPQLCCKYSYTVYVNARTQLANSILWHITQVKCNHSCSLFSSIILSFLPETFCHVSPLLFWCFENQWSYLIYEVVFGSLYNLVLFFRSFLTMFSYLLWFDIVFLWYFQGDVGPPGPPGPVSTISTWEPII